MLFHFGTTAYASECGDKNHMPLDKFTGVLALTWENSFCELQLDTAKGIATHPECLNRKTNDPFATKFALHGLWPSCDGTRKGGPRSCPYVEFNYGLDNQQDLTKTFPTLKLAKHEWRAHGGCFGQLSDDDAYFDTSISLYKEFAQSPIQAELETLVGQKIPAGTLENLFDKHFGKGTGDKVRLMCKQDQINKDRNKPRVLILTEIQLFLASANALEDSLKSMMQQSTWSNGRTECDGAILDTIGNQYFY